MELQFERTLKCWSAMVYC